MFQLAKPEPVTRELLPAIGAQPAVKVTFRPQPSPLSLREAREDMWAIMRAGGPDAEERASDAFSRAIVRHNMLAWDGIFDGDTPLQPTPDRILLDDEGTETGRELGTISAFLADPGLMLAADREYVVPWSLREAEKNGLAVSPTGTSAVETAVAGTADRSVTLPATDDATSASTASIALGPTKVRKSGSSSPRSGHKRA